MKQELSTQLRAYLDAIEKHNENYSRVINGLPVNQVAPSIAGLAVYLETGEVSDVPEKDLKAFAKKADKEEADRLEAENQAELERQEAIEASRSPIDQPQE